MSGLEGICLEKDAFYVAALHLHIHHLDLLEIESLVSVSQRILSLDIFSSGLNSSFPTERHLIGE